MNDRRDASLRLLVAVPFAPRRDTAHGGRVVAQLLLRLTSRHRVAVVYLRHVGSAPIDAELKARCELVEEVEHGGDGSIGPQWRRRAHVLAAPLAGVPSQVAARRERRFGCACVALAERWRPDVVQVETDMVADLGPLLRDRSSAAALVLTCHEPGPPASEDQARTTGGRQRLAHRLDAAAWRRYWSRTLPAFDAIVALTDRDREVIETAVSAPRVLTIGLGIDLPDAPLSAGGHGEPSVLFVGGYRHPPNADAALRLLRSIMPEARRRMPGLPLTLVGADPGRELLDAATPDDTVTGIVPSVTKYLDDAALLALPLRLGGGMRVKLLEALAAGKAVVASPLAADGLDVRDGEELMLAETDHEFAERIVALAGDEHMRSRLGHRARKWAQQHLSWDSRVSMYEQLYRSLLASRAR